MIALKQLIKTWSRIRPFPYATYNVFSG